MPRVFTYDRLVSVEIHLRKVADDPFTMVVTYTLGSSTGPSLVDSVDITLTPAQITQLRTFIDNTVIPAIKTKEGIA